MSGQLESALVIALRSTLRWESALDAPSQGTLAPVNPLTALDARVYQQRDRQLADRDLIVAAAVVETSITVSDIYNYAAIKPQLEGPVVKDLPFATTELGSSGTSATVRQALNASVPYDAARYTDADLYSRDCLIYEILARACQTAFITPPILRLDAAGTIFTDTSTWSLAEGVRQRADINPILPLNRDLFKLPDQNLADRDNQLAGYVAQMAQVLKNPFASAMRIYVRVDSTGSGSREAEIYVLTSDDGVNRVWQAEPALSDRNQIVYNIANKTLQWTRERINDVHVPQIYAMVIPGIDAGQLLTTLAEVPETKDAQFWRTKAGLIVPSGEQLVDTALGLNFTASSVASGGVTQIDSASLTVPDLLSLSMNGSLTAGAYRVSVLAVPSPRVEISGAQNQSATSGTLGGATFDINVPSGSIAAKSYLVEGGDGIVYNGGTFMDGQVFPGVSGSTAYSQVGTDLSTIRQYALSFNLTLPPGPWTATLDYTNLTGTTSGFGIKAQYLASGATATDVIQDVVPFQASSVNGAIVSTPKANFIASTGGFSFPIYWTYGTGQLHIRKLTFESPAQVGHYAITGGFGGDTANINVFGTAFQPDVFRFDFTSAGSVYPASFGALWVADASVPVKFKQVQVQSIGTYTPTPVASEFSGWRQECLERAEQTIQQSYIAVVNAYGTDTPTFRDSGSRWSAGATEDWMSFAETLHPRLREVVGIDTSSVIDSYQYTVTVGPIVYNGTTYQVGDRFYGVAASGTVYTGGTINQVGAFKKSTPGHLGKPALIPFGLSYTSAGTVLAHYDTPFSVPVIVTCQPWMIDMGVYVAQDDFWTPDYLPAIQ